MTVILIWFDHGDRSETGSSAVSSVISRWSRPISRAPPGPATGDGEMEPTRRRKLSETLGWGLGSERPVREETRCVARDISSIYSINNYFSLHLRISSCLLLLLILSTFICDLWRKYFIWIRTTGNFWSFIFLQLFKLLELCRYKSFLRTL